MTDLANIRQDIGASESGEQLQRACEFMTRELIEGVRHGFFEMAVTVEIGQSKKKIITIRAGKSHRFVV
jgi:hypothetical protein